MRVCSQLVVCLVLLLQIRVISMFRFILPKVLQKHLSHSYNSRYTWLQCSTKVRVYDNVLSSNQSYILDNEACSGGPIGHSLMIRNTSTTLSYTPRTSIENTIHNILIQLNDSSEIVEYWWRDEWMSLEMHRDLDEKLGQQSNIFKCPLQAHVLYLHVGSQVQGPTLVFTENSSFCYDSVTVVPARTGRLLTFNGSLMHSVPRPSLAYLDPSEGMYVSYHYEYYCLLIIYVIVAYIG